jgi:hypothetical protein
LFQLKYRIRTLDDYRKYLDKRSISKKDDSSLEPQTQDVFLPEISNEKDKKNKQTFAIPNLKASTGLGYRLLDRKITQGTFDTSTKSNGQPFIELDSLFKLNLISSHGRVEFQHWLGGSEGLSSDFLFSLNHFLSDFRLSRFIGIKYEKSGFISSEDGVRSASASKSTILVLGIRFAWSSKIKTVLAYESGLNSHLKNKGSDFNYKGLLAQSQRYFYNNWGLRLKYRNSKNSKSEEKKTNSFKPLD